MEMEDTERNDTNGNGNGGASPAAAGAKKRLLPMELRRRRRAAKLLGSNKSDLSAIAEAAAPQDANAPVKSSDADAEHALSNKQQLPETDAHVRIDANDEAQDALMASLSRSTSTSSSASSVLPTPSTAASRLSSFYNWSAVERKRQRLQTRQVADVPSKFHATRVPVDLTPKAKVTILTAFPLPFLRPSSMVRRAAMQRFVATSAEPLTVAGSLDDQHEVQWHQTLHYFAHPATPLPASITLNRMAVATKTDSAKPELLNDERVFYTMRLQQWQVAFRDAYFSFRGRSQQQRTKDTSAAFYVRSHDCVVCFYYEAPAAARQSKDSDRATNEHPELSLLGICLELREQQQQGRSAERSHSRLCAVMSQSTARIRKALHHLHVEYAIPYSHASATQRDIGHLHVLEAELVAMEAKSGPPLQQNVHGADSLLYFRGHEAVHGLYEFLINRKPLTKEDVPEIFALHPFANAAIKSLDVKYMGRVAAGASDESGPTTMFRTEITGFCFPSALRELLDILKREYESEHAEPPQIVGGSSLPLQRSVSTASSASGSAVAGTVIRAYMEPVALTERFNALHLSLNAIWKKSVSSTTFEERERWKQELELSKRRIENVVLRSGSRTDPSTEGGNGDDEDASALFEVETTARVLA